MTSVNAVVPAVRAVCGVVVRDRDGRVLMVRRSGEGTWGLPGGGIEPGETWEQATVRECLEETGWEIRLAGLLGIYSDPASQIHRYPSGTSVHFVGAVFHGSAVRLVGSPDDEVAEIGWFSLDDLPRPLFAADVPVLEDAARTEAGPFVR